MGYVFAVMWLIIGVYLIVNGIKEHKILCFLGSYFVFLCLWWLANELTPGVDMLKDAPYVIILRCISGAVLIAAVAVYAIERRRRKGCGDDQEKQ